MKFGMRCYSEFVNVMNNGSGQVILFFCKYIKSNLQVYMNTMPHFEVMAILEKSFLLHREVHNLDSCSEVLTNTDIILLGSQSTDM